jgi:hypothetical protein
MSTSLGSASFKDPRGDLLDENDEAVGRPRYVDVRSFAAETSDTDLLLRMELDAAPPKSHSSEVESLSYIFVIEATGDEEWDYWIGLDNRTDGSYVGSLDDFVDTHHYEGAEFRGTVVLVDEIILARVPLTLLRSPTTLGVCVITQSTDAVSGAVEAEDNAPGDCLGGGKLVRLTA